MSAKKLFRALVLLLTVTSLVFMSACSGGFADPSRDERVIEIQKQKARLHQEYITIEEEVMQTLELGEARVANLGLVFLGVDSILQTSIVPVMNQYSEANLTGIMCLSEENMPGLEGKISREYFDTLINDHGWTCALYWGEDIELGNDGASALESYIQHMRQVLEDEDIPMPDTIVFRTGSYLPSAMDEILERYGILFAVHHGEEKLSRIEESTDSAVYHPGALGWQVEAVDGVRYGKQMFIEDLYDAGGLGVFVISFFGTDHADYDPLSYYDDLSLSESFGKMIAYIAGRAESKEINVLGLKAGLEGRIVYLHMWDETIYPLIEARQAEVMAQMNELERQLVAIYAEYMDR